ncbi:hypothetical protein IP88_15140 [alpha proteobacterium AAP81b]|nr:hypothetical protein IP88_15140 [alpha proteobacterium AAP81b]
MGHSQASKAASRARILGEAAARLRSEGLQGLGVAGLMQAAGLTHGGFYRHFGSRDELLAAALAAALAEGVAMAADRGAGGDSGGGAGEGADADIDLRRLVRGYLSRRHRDAGTAACAISALAGEVGRDSPALKAVMAPHVEAFLDGVAAGTGDDGHAALVVSALVGAVTLARVLPAERSDVLLHQVQEGLLALLEAG